MPSPAFSRLVRFIPSSDPSRILIGQPVQHEGDVGKAVRDGERVDVAVFSGTSVLQPGTETGGVDSIDRILSPLAQNEVGTIRCIGLNYKQHAEECGMPLPSVPTVFLKPNTALGDPWPATTLIPRIIQADDCGDYESELAVVIGKQAKNVPESEAMAYVLGYTAANDVSSRTSQLNQSQWSFSKGFDDSCPLGPTLVSTSLIPDPIARCSMTAQRYVVWQAIRYGFRLLRSDLIFGIPKLVSFLSQSTTLPPGTVIITGTPAGVGMGKKPKEMLKAGDEFSVEISPHIDTLINVFENEKQDCKLGSASIAVQK